MTGLVLDASAALAWCFKDEQSTDGYALLQQVVAEFALVPAVWALEVTNTLAEAERKRRISTAEVNEHLSLFESLSIRVDETTIARVLSAVLNLVRSEGLASYDAAYLELAKIGRASCRERV